MTGAGRTNGRVDRPGRRALFSGPDTAETGSAGSDRPAPESGQGRRALFSDAAPAGDTVVSTPGRRVVGKGRVVVWCRTCLTGTAMPLVSLGVALVPSLWLPTRRWSRLMRCPACGRISWCRLEWAGSEEP